MADMCRVWKQVHAACIEKSEFRLVCNPNFVNRQRLYMIHQAQICGLHIIVHAVSHVLCDSWNCSNALFRKNY